MYSRFSSNPRHPCNLREIDQSIQFRQVSIYE